MSNERPLAPRPVFETLPKAVSAALDDKTFCMERAVLTHRAKSFQCSADEVDAEFAKQKWAREQAAKTKCEEVEGE